MLRRCPRTPRRASTCWPSRAGRPATSIARTASSCPRRRCTRTTSSRMSEATLEAYIRQLLESHRTPQVTVAWQGGEPTLMKLDFFRRAVELVEKYRRPGQIVQHTFQTNGMLLDDDWCAFFKQHDFLVGLSVDGPRELHDTYRVDRRGQGTFDLVMRGWRYLRKHGVDFNILCTVNAANQNHGRAVYRFFRDELGAKWVQFIPIVERATEQTIEIANLGWSEQPGQQAPALHADRQPGHRALGRRRAVRPLPRRRLRGVGAPRRGPGLRAALRRDARGLLRPPPAVHPRADLRLRPGARAQRRPLLLRSLRRAALQARQHPRDAHARARGLARAAQVRRGQARHADGAVPAAARSGRCATAAARRTGSRCRATASRARTTSARASSSSSRTRGPAMQSDGAAAAAAPRAVRRDGVDRRARTRRRGAYQPCPCGSGKKFRFCHGDNAPASPFSGVDRATVPRRRDCFWEPGGLTPIRNCATTERKRPWQRRNPTS